MQIGHELRICGMSRDQHVVHVARMAGCVSQPFNAREKRQMGKEPRKITEAAQRREAAVGVDVLTQQRDLADAGASETAHFVLYIGDGAGEFRTARIGDDTKSAKFIAALLNRHESGDATRDRFLRRGSRQMAIFFLSGKISFDDAAVVLSEAFEKAWQAMIALGTEDDIDSGRPADNLLAFGLGHTASNGDGQMTSAAGF